MQHFLSTIVLVTVPLIVQGLDLPDLSGIIIPEDATESETKQIINTELTKNNESAATDEIVSAPIYTDAECNLWLQTLIQSDVDNSQGLSENEYHSFLSNINDPPYIAQYFENIPTFDDLPWVFRVVHKSLACHCQKLGMDEECCEGDDAEVLLLEFGSDNEAALTNQSRDAVQEEYKDLFCQQIAYVLRKSVPSPSPTGYPTESPSKNPSGTPTKTPSSSPVTDGPTLSPVTLSPTTSEPVVDEVRAIEQPVEEEDEGLSTGAIIGIIVAALAVLLALIALILYKRRKQPMESAPEADLEAPPPDAEVPEPQPEPEPAMETNAGDEPHDDDESSAPSVWSDSDGDDDHTGMLVETEGDDNGVTAGSALAAMGAASTVTAQLSPKLSGGAAKR